MKGERIPDPHHVARLCNAKHIDDRAIQATGFMLRASESILEHYPAHG